MMKIKIFLIFSFIFTTALFSQSITDDEQKLLAQLKKLNDLKYNSGDYDSLADASSRFGIMLFDYLSGEPETMKKSFELLLNEGLDIASSDDGLFRIYSWDTQTGGTMRFYENIYQYISAGKVITQKPVSSTEGDPKSWYSEIYTMKSGSSVYYLGLEYSDFSSRDKYTGIHFFQIEKGKLLDSVPLVKTREGFSTAIGTGYNFFSVAQRQERPVKLVKFNSSNKSISVTVVNDNGDVTDKIDTYVFNGNYFELKK